MQETVSRLRFIESHTGTKPERFADVVLDGLNAPQKRLPCRYFYDEAGSNLFEQICLLPEYYLTRTERALLAQYADQIVAGARRLSALVEFGSGSGDKTRLLLEAAMRQSGSIEYIPIDISGEFLFEASNRLLRQYPDLRITAIASEYSHAMERIPRAEGARLFLFLGSNIGNFEADECVEFLNRIRSAMYPSDRLLIGIDLAKPAHRIEPAYNDSEGITAMFNKNMLSRINRELSADFQLDEFRHEAPFVESHSRIEMRLVSARDQVVTIRSLNRQIAFRQGEYIHTENSHKYSMNRFEEMVGLARLELGRRWVDNDVGFALCMLSCANTPEME